MSILPKEANFKMSKTKITKQVYVIYYYCVEQFVFFILYLSDIKWLIQVYFVSQFCHGFIIKIRRQMHLFSLRGQYFSPCCPRSRRLWMVRWNSNQVLLWIHWRKTSLLHLDQNDGAIDVGPLGSPSVKHDLDRRIAGRIDPTAKNRRPLTWIWAWSQWLAEFTVISAIQKPSQKNDTCLWG